MHQDKGLSHTLQNPSGDASRIGLVTPSSWRWAWGHVLHHLAWVCPRMVASLSWWQGLVTKPQQQDTVQEMNPASSVDKTGAAGEWNIGDPFRKATSPDVMKGLWSRPHT